MDLIVASSRGKNIGHHLINPNLSIPIKTYYKSSASIISLATMASQITLQYNKHPTQKVHVYFLAGLPDITPLSDPATGCIRRWWSGRLPRKPPWGSYRPSGGQRRPWGSWELSQSSARSPPWALKHGTPNDYNNTKQPTWNTHNIISAPHKTIHITHTTCK